MLYLWYTFLVLMALYIIICAVVFFYQERLMFFPQTLPAEYVFRFGTTPCEEVFLEDKGAENRLHALWFKQKTGKANRVVLYFHGNAGSLANWGGVAQDFLPLGYDVLILDYRTYGKSRGALSQKRLFADAQLAYHFACQHYEAGKITLYGRSIGTGIAAYTASVGKAERLILETPYYNFVSLISHHVRILPAFLLLRYRFATDVYVGKTACPVYIFHGTEDATIPYEQGKRLAKLIPSEHFVTIEGGTHNDLSDYERYHTHLKKILLP